MGEGARWFFRTLTDGIREYPRIAALDVLAQVAGEFNFERRATFEHLILDSKPGDFVFVVVLVYHLPAEFSYKSVSGFMISLGLEF